MKLQRKTGNFCTFPYRVDKPLIRLSLRRNVHSLKNVLYNIFPKNYNFLEKQTSLCYTTSRLIYGENT